MARVDGSLGSLVQGVSQQPSRARLPGQSEEQVNVSNDEVFGISRRPATRHVVSADRYLVDGDTDRITEHGEFQFQQTKMSYLMRIVSAGQNPKLRIQSGDEGHTVDIPVSAYPYFQMDKAKPQFGNRVIFKELGDIVYVLNTQVSVGKLTEKPAYATSQATVVYCRGGQYATGYTVRFDMPGDVQHHFTFATPDGAVADDTPHGQVKYIVKQLYDLITTPNNGSLGTSADSPELVSAADSSWVPDEGKYYMSAGAKSAVTSNFDIVMMGEHLMITPKVLPYEYTVTATETTGSSLLVDVRDEIKDVGRLPTRAPVDTVVKVLESNRAEDDYYLRFVIPNKATGTVHDLKGVWEECTAPDEDFKLDPDTLPHELYLDGSTYRIRTVLWDERAAGSDKSNPFPKFVGERIQDLGDIQGRAVFLHKDSVSMSATEEYSNWFNTTATTTLFTDPLHIRSTATNGKSDLVYAVPFNQDLVIFGTNKAQFVISGSATLESGNVSMKLTSEFDADLGVRPTTVGDRIMFLSWTGKYTHLNEMFLSGSNRSHRRRTVTDHVPRYLPGRGVILATNDIANTALVVTDADRTKAFAYEYLWIDDKRVQSAWSTWEFDAGIEHARMDQGILTTVFKASSGAFLYTEATLYRQDAEGLAFPIHLDYTQTIDLVHDTHITSTVTGFSDTVADTVVLAITGPGVIGMPLEVLSVTPVVETIAVNTSTIKLAEPYTGRVIVGTRYRTRFIPTMPVLRDGDGITITGAELNVGEFLITYDTTGPFTMTRQCDYEDPTDYWELEYSGQTLGDPDFVLGTAPIDSGTAAFPFEDSTTTSKLVIDCDTHLPMTLTEIEWRGTVRNRSKRLINGG